MSLIFCGYLNLNLKRFPSHKGPLGGADLRFNSHQPDISRSCKSTDTGLVCRVGCLFKFPACTCTNLLPGEQRHMCVNNLPKVEREAPRPEIEPATSRLLVRRPNNYATTPHHFVVNANLISCTSSDLKQVSYFNKETKTNTPHKSIVQSMALPTHSFTGIHSWRWQLIAHAPSAYQF